MMIHELLFTKQHDFPGGGLMCSSAATMMCVYMSSTKPVSMKHLSASKIDEIMSIASDFHTAHYKNTMATIWEVITMSKLTERISKPLSMIKISKITEISGLIRGTPPEMASLTCTDFHQAVTGLKPGTCYAVTFNKHTISFGLQAETYWLCDSLTGTFHTTGDLAEFIELHEDRLPAHPTHIAYSGALFT